MAKYKVIKDLTIVPKGLMVAYDPKGQYYGQVIIPMGTIVDATITGGRTNYYNFKYNGNEFSMIYSEAYKYLEQVSESTIVAAKYKFIKDYNTNIGTGTSQPVTIKAGEIYEESNVATNDMGLTSHVINYKGIKDITVPNEYLQRITVSTPETTKPTTTTIFTTKNVIIGLAFIAAVFGILKWQKVI